MKQPVQEPPPKPPERLGLTEQYIGFLLLVLVKAGLIDVRHFDSTRAEAKTLTICPGSDWATSRARS